MFQTPSNIKDLREALAAHLGRPDYFLAIHSFFDGEVIFARDVVQLNFDLAPFPVDVENVWNWFKAQLRGPASQQTFVYELGFDSEAEQDSVRENLVEITRGTVMTMWIIDLAYQQAGASGRRFVVVSIRDKKTAQVFRETLHGRDVSPAT